MGKLEFIFLMNILKLNGNAVVNIFTEKCGGLWLKIVMPV